MLLADPNVRLMRGGAVMIRAFGSANLSQGQGLNYSGCQMQIPVQCRANLIKNFCSRRLESLGKDRVEFQGNRINGSPALYSPRPLHTCNQDLDIARIVLMPFEAVVMLMFGIAGATEGDGRRVDVKTLGLLI